MTDDKTYATYARFGGLAWFYGWFLVGFRPQKLFGGYAAEFAHQGCDLRLYEVSRNMPLIPSFWFKPDGMYDVTDEMMIELARSGHDLPDNIPT